MTIDDIEKMNVGDLVIPDGVGFEGEVPLSTKCPGIIKKVEMGTPFFSPQVLIYWFQKRFQTWEHPDSVKVVSSIKK